MAWKLRVNFTDGTSTVDDEDYEYKEAAEWGMQIWLDSWNAGAETLELAGEDFSDAQIDSFEIWEE